MAAFVSLDVRPILRDGGEPFEQIMDKSSIGFHNAGRFRVVAARFQVGTIAHGFGSIEGNTRLSAIVGQR